MKRYKLKMLLFIILVLSLLLVACKKTEEAKAVDSLIASIGELKNISEENITEVEKTVSDAEAAYKALSEKDRKSLDNYDILAETRQELDSIKDSLVKEAISKTENAFRSGDYSEIENIVKGLSNITLENSREQLMKKFDDMGDEIISSLNNGTYYLDEETANKSYLAIDSIVNAAEELHIDQTDSLYTKLELLTDKQAIVRTAVECHDLRVMKELYDFTTVLETFSVGLSMGSVYMVGQAQIETEAMIRQMNYQGSYVYAQKYVNAANTLNEGMKLILSAYTSGSSTNAKKGAQKAKDALAIFTELNEIMIDANNGNINNILGS